jgi:L-2-hydroxyglutarate oxidase
MKKQKVVIIGGGIVGMATAYQLLQKNPECQLIILEKEEGPAKHQTGHNSGVIHSGIYYTPGSLKAINCKRGYDLLLDFCQKEKIPYDICGKIIVATDKKELPILEHIYKKGEANGLEKIRHLSAEEIKEIEPFATGIKGIFVPQTGIVDYVKVTEKLAEKATEAGAEIRYSFKVKEIQKKGQHIQIHGDQGVEEADIAINCAGLYCDKIFKMDSGDTGDMKIIPFRGEYYLIKKERRDLVKNLIYPVPNPSFPFLGVHFTRRIDGQIEAGPNAVLAYRREGYKKSEVHIGELWESISWPGFIKVAAKYWKTGLGEIYRSYYKEAFTKALQKLIPDIQAQDLIPSGAGVRAQACLKNGTLPDDFLIKETDKMIHVLNAPSPAATSSLSIGLTVSDMALQKLQNI